MQDNKWVVGLIFLLAIIGVSIWGFGKYQPKATEPKVAGTETSAGTSTGTPAYFDDNAKVMFFYSDGCSWCTKEKDVLEVLAKDGYKVKPMDVGKNQNYWTDYKINGTPTFIAANGERLEGYNELDPLKTWLDSHK